MSMPTIIVYLFLQKKIMNGISIGGTRDIKIRFLEKYIFERLNINKLIILCTSNYILII